MNATNLTEADPTTEPVIPTTSLAKFASGPKSVSELVNLASDTDQRFCSFDKRLTGLLFDLDTRTKNIADEIDRLSELPKIQRQQLVDKQVIKVRRELREKSETGRYDQLRALKAVDDQIIAVESQFATPAHLLVRKGLGSSERSRYLEQIAHSGPLELQNFAAYAVATDNKVLGAAIMTKLDSLPRRDRELVGVSRHELAEALVGEERRKAQNAITIIRNRVREAFTKNREFESGRKNTKERIGLALAKRNETSTQDDGGDDA